MGAAGSCASDIAPWHTGAIVMLGADLAQVQSPS